MIENNTKGKKDVGYKDIPHQKMALYKLIDK